jgi:hypothetical protein
MSIFIPHFTFAQLLNITRTMWFKTGPSAGDCTEHSVWLCEDCKADEELVWIEIRKRVKRGQQLGELVSWE